MRKAQQKDILNIIETMGQAHEEIRQALEKRALDTAKQILIECQECAIELGNAIEQIEGEGFASVSYLEKYCDTVYRLFEETDADSNPTKVAKTLKKAILKVENSVKNDVKIRKEVVFLPYKASMWDSLESVYLAAKEDEDCDAYCVPIPYYDRRADGSLGMMHYEGNEYPKNIEVTDYRTYNLEERHPDVIYIHNPYDEWNHVTSVPERYYAKNLCRHTDKLVYIPYFILGETNANDQSDVNGMKHFCFLPGVIYADKVIVQSENMRQIYITEYIKAAKEVGLSGTHIDRKFQEQKILGLGSPKVDKVLNTKKEDLEIPAEWMKIIEKPDGTWKKIVFYNTTINGLLHNDEQMLKKMERVFEIFREKQDEAALLWRPHPLIENTLTSMRPRLWEEYRKIRDRYIAEGWGIYDDTADMDRAVALSDAYFGDQSSVVQVYQKTGKPVMIQQCNYVESPYTIAQTKAIVYAEEYYWYVPTLGDSLYRLNPKTMRIEYICSMTSGKEGYWLYSNIVYVDNKLYFIPHRAVDIAIYDIRKEELRKITFREKCTAGMQGVAFCGYGICGEKIYLYPKSYQAIVCIDIKTEKIERYILPEEKEEIIFGDACLHQESVIFPYYGTNRIMCFDTNKKIFKVFVLEEDFHCASVYESEENVYLIPTKIREGVKVWDAKGESLDRCISFSREEVEESNQERYIYEKGEKRCLTKLDFGNGRRKGDNIYLSGYGFLHGIVLNVIEEKIQNWNLPVDLMCMNEGQLFNYTDRILGITEEKEELVVVNGINGEWISVYAEDRYEVMQQNVRYTDGTKKKILNNVKQMYEVEIGIIPFIEQFVGNTEKEQDTENIREAGYTIYNALCEERKYVTG